MLHVAMPVQSIPATTDSAVEAASLLRREKAEEAGLHPGNHQQAKTYNRIKLRIRIISSVLSFVLMAILVISGLTLALEYWVRSWAEGEYTILLIFSATLGLLQSAVTLPLGFYSGFILEHHYDLSNQSIGQWALERLKGMLVTIPLLLGIVVVLYYCLTTYGNLWWLPVGLVLTLLSVVLARLAPALIMPLFYRFTPLPEGSLKQRLIQLCNDTGLRIEGVFSFNMSKNTKKANAGFTGIGKSKRIILGDTLIDEFTEDEIETVFAHELGHYTHHHIIIGIITGVTVTFTGLFVAARLYTWSLPVFGFSSITDIAALPLLSLWLALFGLVTGPLGNILSRRHERQADVYAVRKSGNRAAFVSALRKLARMNLADPEPHPLVEFLFHSHPPVPKRIANVEALDRQ